MSMVAAGEPAEFGAESDPPVFHRLRVDRGAVIPRRACIGSPSPPLISDTDTGHSVQIEPVRPLKRNGCTTSRGRGSLPARRFEAGAHEVRRGARAGFPANGACHLAAPGLVKPQLRGCLWGWSPKAQPVCPRRRPQAVHPWSSAGSLLICGSRKQRGTAWRWGPGSEVPLAPPPGPHLRSHGDGQLLVRPSLGAVSVRCRVVPPGRLFGRQGGRGDESPRRLPLTPPSSHESGRRGRIGVGQFGPKQNNGPTTRDRRVSRLRSVLRTQVGNRGSRSRSSVCSAPRRMTRTVAPARNSSMAKKKEFPASSCRGSRWRSEVFL